MNDITVMLEALDKIDQLANFCFGIGFGSFSIMQELESFREYIRDGQVFIDVGGNKGEYTEGILKLYNPQEVHVFEPSQTNIEALRSRFSNNNKVIVNEFGLSDVNSESTLYSDSNGSGLASLSKRRLDHFDINFNLEERIRLIRFDEYWENNIKNKYIDLFKIDVEGHELDVLNGVGNRIDDIKIVQFEFGGCNIDSRTYFQDFWYYFREHDFDIYRISPVGPMKIMKYREQDERFITTNYFAVNKRLIRI